MTIEPTKDEMIAAWQQFKATALHDVLLGHLIKTNIDLAAEGLLWGIFYNGFYAGRGYPAPKGIGHG